MATQNYKVRAAEIRTFGTDSKKFAYVTAGTTWGRPVHITFFEDYQIEMLEEAIAKNTLAQLEPIPGNIDIIDVPAHYKKNREGALINDDNGNPIIYTKLAVFYMTEKGEDAETKGKRIFRDFIKAGSWELATEGMPSEDGSSNDPL